MREILFRGKRLDNGQWVEGYYIGGNGEYNSCEICDINDFTLHCVDVDPETVGQYTGLTDKNGRKIFEGDVMSFSAYGRNYIGTVVFADGNFSILCKNASPFLDDAIKRQEAIVVGNIYDNPELFKE